MATIFRWLLRLFMVAVAFGLAAVVLVYWFATRSIPDYSANYRTDDVTAPLEIVRDNANVPHILGSADADVYFGLGFAHAQDRLWQMMLLRRTAQGRLSELFGERTFQTDDLLRRLDFYTLAGQSFEVQDAPTKAALRAYASGVNAWLSEINQSARGRGAPEYWLFAPDIAPWQPQDSLAVLKLLSLQLASHVQDEVLRARVSLLLGNQRLADIMPDVPGAPIAALPEFSSLFPTAPRSFASAPPRDPLSPVQPRGFGGASNGWAAAPARSAAGGTLLANDPHLPFSAPSLWYLARLELKSGAVIGGTVPGLPAILVGRSDSLGWGLTTAYVDSQDVFIERVNPDNPNEVLTPDGYRALRGRPSIIRIKDAEPRTIELRWSENGPILPGMHFDLGTITPAGHLTSLAWTALWPDDTTMSALLGVNRSQSRAEAIEALKATITPAQNVILADSEGIAMDVAGAVPRRAARHQSQGRIPAPGWRSENRWQGRAASASQPTIVDPAGGILGNTNNKTTDRPFPFHLSHSWGDTQRIQRWQRLMQSREVHTRESFIEAQLDTVSVTARGLLPLVGRELWFTGEAAPEGTPEHLRQRALDLLANWNGEMNEHLPEPLLYATWLRAIQERLIRDDLGPMAAEFPHVEPLFIERVYRDIDGASAWCDVLRSAPIETCQDIASLALDDALLWIAERYGTSLEALRWGDAHQAHHDHQVLGDTPILNWFTNIRQSTSGGDNTLQRGLTSGQGDAPFVNVHGAGFRGVYDFADPDSSVFIITGGQSGHPLSRHYDDLGELWRRGEYIPMSLDPDLARAAAVGITSIVPNP